MFPMWMIYVILLLVIVSLSLYYKKLYNQKIFIENFDENYRNNDVLKSYDIYNGNYQNLQDKNNHLETSLLNNNYGSYYDTIYNNFSLLNTNTGKLSEEINNRSQKLQQNINNLNSDLTKDSDFIDNNKMNIIQKYNKIIDQNFSQPKENIQKELQQVINKNMNDVVTKYVSGITTNDTNINNINKKYSDGVKASSELLNGMKITLQQSLEQNVNNSLDLKKKSLAMNQLSNNPGILVRIYNSNTSNPNDNVCNSKVLPNNECMTMYGPWISSPGLVSNISNVITGEKVYIKFDDIYTKMVLASGEGRYYQGPVSNFKPCNWNSYNIAPPGVYNIQLASSSVCTPVQIQTQSVNLNKVGTLSKEYIVPGLNYYMTSRIDPFFSNTKSPGIYRYLEFSGNLSIPAETNIIEFKLESALGSRLYFAGSLLIDKFYQSISVDATSTINYVRPGQKVAFKLQTIEGLDTTNSYIMLKWRINRTGNFVSIPMEYFFLPNVD
jgi:hypothetical protein